jgi:hypothetical protein
VFFIVVYLSDWGRRSTVLGERGAGWAELVCSAYVVGEGDIRVVLGFKVIRGVMKYQC